MTKMNENLVMNRYCVIYFLFTMMNAKKVSVFTKSFVNVFINWNISH